MARFGQGVNASLGKTNYSNYLAGALQGAKGVAAGGQAIGKGIANLGASAGDAIKTYGENQKKNKAMEGSIKSTTRILTGMLGTKGLDPNTEKTITELLQGINDSESSLSTRYAQAQGATEKAVQLFNFGQRIEDRKTATANAEVARRLNEQQILASQAATDLSNIRLQEAERKKSEDEKFARAVAANTEAGTGVVNTEGIASAFAQEGGSNLSEYNKDIAAFEGESKLQKIEGTDYGIINGQVIPLHEASKDKADKAAYEKKKRDYEALPRGEKFSQEIDAIDKAVSSGFLSEVDRDSAVADVKKRIYGVRDEDELSGKAALMALSEIINKQPNAK